MSQLITSAQMRAVEHGLLNSGAVTGAQLIDRAAQGVVDGVLHRWPGLEACPGRAAVYCGPGNNGADGYVVAQKLRSLGWLVAVWSTCDPAAQLTGDARVAWLGSVDVNGPVAVMDEGSTPLDDPFWDTPPDLIIDAIFGIGLTRDLPNSIEHPLAAIQHYKVQRMVHPPTVAIDVPSGLCADSGRNRGNRCLYDLTVTFHRPKPGHYLADGPALCGALKIVDIGLPQSDVGAEGAIGRVAGPSDVLKHTGHKFDHGHGLVLTGGAGRTGAARLAARAAQRIGAGLVTLGVPPSAQLEVANHITSAMLVRVNDGAAFASVLGDTRINALCLGPGLGLTERAAGLIHTALTTGRPTVLDADALTLLAADPDLMALLHPKCVLTPHGGEFARLFPDLATELHAPCGPGPALSKVDITCQAAARAGCTVLYKGADTVIAAPNAATMIHAAAYERATPWLATAGAGDVLAGLITGLLARGHSPHAAACSAAWLHVECALAFGPGLVAEDLAETLPMVLRQLAKDPKMT